MSPGGAYAETPTPTLAGRFTACLSARRIKPPPPDQDDTRRRRFRTTAFSSRTPSIGLTLNHAVLRLSRARARSLIVIRVRSPAPFQKAQPILSLVEGKIRRAVLSPIARIALRLTLRIWERCVLPTSATNTKARAPMNRSTPEPAAYAAVTTFARAQRPKPMSPTKRGAKPPVRRPSSG